MTSVDSAYATSGLSACFRGQPGRSVIVVHRKLSALLQRLYLQFWDTETQWDIIWNEPTNAWDKRLQSFLVWYPDQTAYHLRMRILNHACCSDISVRQHYKDYI